MRVIDLISRLAQEPDLHAEVLTPDGFPVHVARSKQSCGIVYITDEPEDETPTEPVRGDTLAADERAREERLDRTIAHLLDYAYHDIGYSWQGLTTKERNILGSPDVFADVLAFMREHK